jgi:hypothetical protein
MSAVPALGGSTPLGRRGMLVRLVALTVLAGAALGVRATGVLHPGEPSPPLPGWARVDDRVLRGGQPTDLDLMQLRDSFGVRAVVDVDGTDVDERAVTEGLGLRLLVLDVGPSEAPAPQDVLAVARLARTAGGPVYLHDSTGHGPVVAVAAALRVLGGTPVRALPPADTAGLSPAQVLALRDVETVVRGGRPRDDGYAKLREVAG